MLGADGISFRLPPGRKLAEPVQQALKKVHCSLGHPSHKDLSRFLKLGGAKGEVLEAVNWMECLTCQHGRKPVTHRTASIPPAQVVFGDEVQMDCFQIHDSAGKGFWFLSIIDRANSYHVIRMMKNHSPDELYKCYVDGWLQWAGPPNQITVDMEGGFCGKPFWEQVARSGTLPLSIAGTAHWQAGKIERHNQIIKDIMRNVINHTQCVGLERMSEVALEAVHAKNSLVREHGWSPVALVFGREPRVFGELIEQGNPTCYHPDVGTSESDVARRMRYRYHAKMEYLKSQARHMLSRTVHERTRRISQPRVGQQVFYWRDDSKRNREKGTKWNGPACVVGVQGSNAWVASGGRCLLIAGSHLREVVGDETHYGDVQEGDALPTEPPKHVPKQILELAQQGGWSKDDFGNPVLVSKVAWAYRTPTPRYDGNTMPFRTTWAFTAGRWYLMEKEVCWSRLEDPHGIIPGGPVSTLITIFYSRTRKDMCQDDVPWKSQKKSRTMVENMFPRSHGVHVVNSQNRLRKLLDKEVPIDKIPNTEWPAYQEAIKKEWNSWLEYDSCRVLSLEESNEIEKTKKDRILPSRFVLRNKNAGLIAPDGTPMPLKAKARLCLAGHLCPDSLSGETQVDSPTIERLSTMIFLNLVVCFGWLDSWYVGDISNAFLQGAELVGKEMFMRQPKQGLPGMKPGQLLQLRKAVYGRPDAPRAWYNELSRVLQQEFQFEKSVIDPAMFYLRHPDHGTICGLLVVHVDDVMLAIDQSTFAEQTAERFHARFPFGTWQNVAREKAGITYCGKEISIKGHDRNRYVTLSQNGFIDGRLEMIHIPKERAAKIEERVLEHEKTDYRSLVGSLQWLASQSRPDIAFEVNQLQKRISDLRVGDLIRANKCAKEVLNDRYELEFHDLGKDVEIVAFHDASLFNSVGVEITDKEADDVLLSGREKKLVYSQKGAILGLISKGEMETVGKKVRMNILDWKSTTNKRVIESSLAAETHAAIMAKGLARFVQAILTESRFGSKLITAFDEEDWQQIIPLNMITDCKSIYDSVKKDGQHLGDKGSIIQVILLRQMCSVRPTTSKARLWWVPTRDQLADTLTKSGRGKLLRSTLGWAQFHEVSAAKIKAAKHTQIKEKVTSVKDS